MTNLVQLNRLSLIFLIQFFLCLSVGITGVWKPYDDFTEGLDAVKEDPGQAKFGKKWIQYTPEARLKMDIVDNELVFQVAQAGDRDPGFKLGFGWAKKDIAGIQFTVKSAELSKAGGWFGVLCTDEEPNWKANNWIFGASPSHQHDWGPKTYFGSGSFGKLGGWKTFAYSDIPDNQNVDRTYRLQWNKANQQMAITIDPGQKTEWKKEDVHSNADLGTFPWWTIYLSADQVVKVIIDDVYVLSKSLPYVVDPHQKVVLAWAKLKVKF